MPDTIDYSPLDPQLLRNNIDIDYFKRFNNTFGRHAGNAFLREIGGFPRGQVRAGDTACRYRGEEVHP